MDVERLRVEVPPENQRAAGSKSTESRRGKAHPDWLVDEIKADNASVVTLPDDPEKEPLEWDIKHLTLHGLGAAKAASFQANLTNSKPPGDIQTTGSFGPWNSESPGGTPASGTYSFQNANLSVFSGIAGTLSSTGNYRGALNRIEVAGQTDTPDFSVRVRGNPVHLTTEFHAVVDGRDGNTRLEPVNVQFGRSSLMTRGSVEGHKGVMGKTVSLDVTAAGARLEDILHLAVKGRQPIMTGAASFRMRLVIPPGDLDIAQKIQLQGAFTADAAHFSNLDIQERVNKLSHKGSGHPKTPDTDSVASDFKGRFKANHGVITFQNLSFQVPGAEVLLNGQYGLVSEEMDFRGKIRLQAKLSQTTTGFKSLLLKAVDPFFKKKDAGAVLPVRIDGTRDKPSFGLNFHGRHGSQP